MIKEIGLNQYYDILRPCFNTGDLLLYKNWWLIELFSEFSHASGIIRFDKFEETKGRIVLAEMFNQKSILPKMEFNYASERIINQKTYWLPGGLNKYEQEKFKGLALHFKIQDVEYHFKTLLAKSFSHGEWYHALNSDEGKKKLICSALYCLLWCYSKGLKLPDYPPAPVELIQLIGMQNPVKIYER